MYFMAAYSRESNWMKGMVIQLTKFNILRLCHCRVDCLEWGSGLSKVHIMKKIIMEYFVLELVC